MLQEPPIIEPFPPAPLSTDPDTFDSKTDEFNAHQVKGVAQYNAAGAATYKNASTAYLSASGAKNSEIAAFKYQTAAALSAEVAAAVVNAPVWTIGVYPLYAVVFSPSNGFYYRHKVDGQSNIDPAKDSGGWWLMGSPLSSPAVFVYQDTLASPGIDYYLKNSGVTLILPDDPKEGDVIGILVLGFTDCKINPQRQKIRNYEGIMDIEDEKFQATLIFRGNENGGWL